MRFGQSLKRLFWGILIIAAFVTCGNKVTSDAAGKEFTSVPLSETIESTLFFSANDYSAETPKVVCFKDGKGQLNIASYSFGTLSIYRYSDSFGKLSSKITINNPMSYFGYITSDDDSNYYVLWGQDDMNSKNVAVTRLCKYNYSGKLLGKCDIKGFDSNPKSENGVEGDYWGTRIPFHSGSCRMAVSGNVIAVNYAREMYSGHQSNFAFFVNTQTMKRLYADKNSPYCSHSFDQDVIPTDNGGFLFANHGDAYARGFVLEKAGSSTDNIYSKVATFHFREGADRDHGYNETYAQLGGLAATSNAYVLCGSSERTLSRACAPTGGKYLGHSEARDLFVQILKKDYEKFSGAGMYYAPGVTRKVTGKRPVGALTDLYLSGNEVDYGVIWLTKLSSNMYVNNPKIVALSGSNFAVLWEELDYNTRAGSTYCMVLDENGKTVISKTKLSDTARLTGNSDPAYIDGSIYWVTSDYSRNSTLYKLSFSIESKKNITVGDSEYEATLDDKGNVKCLKLLKYNGKASNLTISTAVVDGKTVKITAIGDGAVKNNRYLVNLTIGKYVETVGKSSFAKCSKLKTVKGGSKVTSLGTTSFYNCKALKSFATMGKLKTIGEKAFSGDVKLSKFTIPASVTKIGNSAFSGCSALKSVTIKTTKLTSSKLGNNAFKNINAKAVIKVPASKLSDYKKLLKSRGINKKGQKIKK